MAQLDKYVKMRSRCLLEKKHIDKLCCVLLNRLVLYLILVVAIYVSLCQLNHCIRVWYDWEWIICLRRLADAMLLGLPILFCRKKCIIFPWLVVINLFLLSIIWYYRTYGTIMPISSYFMINNLKGLFPSVWNSVHVKDLLITLPFLCYIVLYCCLYQQIRRNVGFKYKICVLGLIIGIVVSSYWPNKRWLYDNPIYLYGIQQVKTFKEFGLINFWVYQIYFHQGISTEEKNFVENFMRRLPRGIDKCDSVGVKQNLILILVESMQSWPIGLTVDGVEVTPNIDRLLRQTNTVYFPKEMPQTKDGRSSDAQLLINTGLLPLVMGAASGTCTHNTFPSLAGALKEKGYETASFICDGKEYWNQEAMTIAYQFDFLFDNMQGGHGRDKADENLFRAAIPIIKKMQQPFYAQLVTLSTHSPYLKPLIESPIESIDFQNKEVKYYLIAMQYADYCIGEFIRNLVAEGLYENSVVVITGDHEQMPFNQYEERENLDVEDYFVPFIVLNSPLSSKHTGKVIGQMDIYPSLLNLMGCCDYYFTGLGESVFGSKVSNCAMFRSDLGTSGENVTDSVKRHRKDCWKASDILLRMDYFSDHNKDSLVH